MDCFVFCIRNKYQGCNVDGVSGNGTQQGSCSSGYVCQEDGSCKGKPGYVTLNFGQWYNIL